MSGIVKFNTLAVNCSFFQYYCSYLWLQSVRCFQRSWMRISPHTCVRIEIRSLQQHLRYDLDKFVAPRGIQMGWEIGIMRLTWFIGNLILTWICFHAAVGELLPSKTTTATFPLLPSSMRLCLLHDCELSSIGSCQAGFPTWWPDECARG